MHLVKATIPVMPARHGQEGAPKVGSNPWIRDPHVACMPLALLVEHEADARDALESKYGRPSAKQDLQDEGQARRRLANLPIPACSHTTPMRIMCFLTFPRRAKTDLVALCEGARAKGGGQVNLHIKA